MPNATHDHQAAQPQIPIDDPQEHARDVIDAMRDLGTSTPDSEQALRGAGLGLQRTLNKIYGAARGLR